MITHRGFTLIEIAITLTVLGVLITLALPQFTNWLNNTKIRTAAEGISNGLQLSRAEAVRRNLQVQFVLGAANGAGYGQSGWRASALPPGQPAVSLQTATGLEGSSNVSVAVNGVFPPVATTVTFNGLGRVIVNGDGSAAVTQVDVCNSVIPAGSARRMRIVIGAAGNVKMCDPQVAAGDPRACPAAGLPGGLASPNPPCT